MNSSGGGGGAVRRTRGPINKRACQRCRTGKIKCDGNAESGLPCSNCDPGSCKYDNSPRKNKQVEALKQRMSEIEENLTNQKAVTEVLTAKYDLLEKAVEIKEYEKDIMFMLFDNYRFFENNNSQLFHRLMAVLKNGQCFLPILQLMREALVRLNDPGHRDRTQEIMQALENLANRASSSEHHSNTAEPSTDQIAIYQSIQTYLSSGDLSHAMSLTPVHSPLSSATTATSSLALSTSPLYSANSSQIEQQSQHLTSTSTALTNLTIHSPASDHPSYAFNSPSAVVPDEDNKFYECQPSTADLLATSTIDTNAFPGYFQNLDYQSYITASDIFISSEHMEEFPSFQTNSTPSYQTNSDPSFQTNNEPSYQTNSDPPFQTNSEPSFPTNNNP